MMLLPPLFHQFHLDVRCQRLKLRSFREFHSNKRLAGTRVHRDPNRAVVEHPSAAFLQQTRLSLLLAVLVRKNQHCLHRLLIG